MPVYLYGGVWSAAWGVVTVPVRRIWVYGVIVAAAAAAAGPLRPLVREQLHGGFAGVAGARSLRLKPLVREALYGPVSGIAGGRSLRLRLLAHEKLYGPISAPAVSVGRTKPPPLRGAFAGAGSGRGDTAVIPRPYLAPLQDLLPPGIAWTRDADAELTGLMEALSYEPNRLALRALTLLEETDPRTTTELLSDWERVTGLTPAPGASLADRRAALTQQLTSDIPLDIPSLIALAASWGVAITITEYRPLTIGGHIGQALNNFPWPYFWTINAPFVDTLTDAQVAFLTTAAQAHTRVLFNYV